LFERFTDKAIKAILLAEEEVRCLGHDSVGTEQILLGLIGEATGIAAQALRASGVNLKNARLEVEKIIGRGSGLVPTEIPFTPKAVKVLQLSLEISEKIEDKDINTEHLILALVQERESVAFKVLENLNVDLYSLKEAIIQSIANQRKQKNNDLSSSASQETVPQDYFNFLIEVLKIICENSDHKVVYPLLEANLDKLNLNLIRPLVDWKNAALADAQAQSQDIAWIGNLIASFSLLFQELPFGDESNNLEIAIGGYRIALDILSRQTCSKEWSYTSRYLAIAYLNRIKGKRRKNLEIAVNYLDQALSVFEFEDEYKLWYYRGKALAELGYITSAIASYDKALEYQPNFALVWFEKGYLLQQNLQKHKEAISCFQKAIEFNPNDVEALNHLTISLCILGDFEEALDNYNRALEIEPNFVDIRFNRACLLMQLEHDEEAFADFDKVVKLKPDYYEAWYLRGSVLSKLRRNDEAIVSYEQATNIKPDYQEAWFDRGWILLSQWGDFQDTLTKYSLALIVIDTVSVELMTSVEQAFYCFHRAWEIEPNQPRVAETHEFIVKVIQEMIPPAKIEEIAARLAQQGHKSTARWLEEKAEQKFALQQTNSMMSEALYPLIQKLQNLAYELKSGVPSLETQEKIAVEEEIQETQLKFIHKIVLKIWDGAKEVEIHQILEENLDLLSNPNIDLFAGSLSQYIYSIWREPQLPAEVRLPLTKYTGEFCNFLSTFQGRNSIDQITSDKTIVIRGYRSIITELGIQQGIWLDVPEEYSSDLENFKSKLSKIESYLTQKSSLDPNNKNDWSLIITATSLEALGRIYSDLLTQGSTYFYEATVYQELSIQCLQVAIKIYELGDIRKNNDIAQHWALAQTKLGIAYHRSIQGNEADNFDKAIECFENALKIFNSSEHPIEWSLAKRKLGSAYKNRIRGKKIDNLRKAFDCYSDEVLEIVKLTDSPEKFAITLRNLGNIYSEYTEYARSNKAEILEEAIKCYQQALQIYKDINLPNEQAVTQKLLASVYYRQIDEEKTDNQIKILEQVIECYKEESKFATYEQFPSWWATIQYSLGSVYLHYSTIHKDKADNLKLAIEHFQEALSVFTKENYPSDNIGVQSVLGMAYQDLRQYDKAYNTFEDSINTFESLGSNLLQNSATEEDKQKFAERNSDPYLNMVAVCIERASIQNEPEYYLKAIEYIERSKARNLVELLANKNIYPKLELYKNQEHDYQNICQQLDKLRQQIPALQRQLQLSENDEEKAQQIHQLLSELRQQQTNLLEQINKVDQKFKYTQKVEPISFEKIRSLCGENGAILEWYIVYEQFFLFIITPQSKIPIVWRYSQEERTELDNLVDEYLIDYGKYLKDKNQKWKNKLSSYLYRLAQILRIEEILERYLLPLNCQQLILIPHRTFYLFPLHALPLAVNNCYLSDKFPQGVRYAPSCQLLQISQNQQRPNFTNFFGIQNPSQDLIYTDLEVETIRSFFPQNQVLVKEAVTKTALYSDQNLFNAHCSHFSCHGSFNPQFPLESALLLANKERLTLGEIFQLSLSQCRLVTLSACETGLTDINSLSDEYISLPSGFLFAGSPSIVSSLWTVNDLSTTFLMIEFYKNLIQQGDTVAIAIKKAQTWLRNLTCHEFEQELTKSEYQNAIARLQQQLSPANFFELEDAIEIQREKLKQFDSKFKLFANPFYWAAFIAIGI
jgi:CHAT domain-containing protein/tetratricopeptide (TPR) repeat protein